MNVQMYCMCVCDYVGDKKYPEPARTHIENVRIFERPCSTPKKPQKSGVPQISQKPRF